MSQWKEGSHESYLWIRVNKGVTLDLFVCMVYIALVGSKHESKSLFQNLVTDIVEVQTIGGIVLLGGDFHARNAMLPDTINITDLCCCNPSFRLATKARGCKVMGQEGDSRVTSHAPKSAKNVRE